MFKRILFVSIALLLLAIPRLGAQGFEGKIVDHEGNPVPYASIFIKELTRGTTSNSLGLFSLPLPAGEYTIFFRSLGYTEVMRKVTIADKMLQLEIVMPPQTYMIPEVRISADGEDPAYRVMRKTIGLAHYHLNQVATYNAEIYIKGTAYFNNLPRAIAKRIEVGDIKVEEGRAYMMESLNEITYRAPDKYDMRVIASQNTIPGYVNNVNPMDYINASLYEPQIEGFVSPLARNAFFYYDFNFEGSFLQGNHMIDKIRVIPKRKSQQLCSGFLYIVEDLWCLHSSDLEVNTIAGTLFLQQQYANVIMDAWLPVSHKLQMKVQIAGVDAEVTYVSSLKYSNTVLNPNLPKSYFEPVNVANPEEEKEPTPTQEKIQEILEKDEINNRDMAKLDKLVKKEAEEADPDKNKLEVEGTKFSIEPNAVMNDSAFWNSIRPVPLTIEEKQTIEKRDSIYGTGGPIDTLSGDSSAYRLSQIPRGTQVRARDIVTGRTFNSANRKTRIFYGGLVDFSLFSFNTVDGFKYGQSIGIDYRPTRWVAYRSYLTASYAFARRAPEIELRSNILYAPAIRGKISLNLEYASLDFNRETGIPSFTNTSYALFYRESYTKRYESRKATLEHRMDPATGFVFFATLDLQDRRQLYNNSDFSFFFRNSKDTTANIPAHENMLSAFSSSKLLAGQVRLEYTYKYYYRLRDGRKQYFKSDYPTIYAVYRQAFPLENSGWADYSMFYGGFRQTMEVGLLSNLTYKLEAGVFMNRNTMHYSDFMHFKTSPLLFDMAGFDESFLLLDYYRASTSENWIMSHIKFSSSYLLIKLLPWFSERLWKESISAGYINTPGVPHHIEVGYSMDEIGFLFDIGVFTAFESWKYEGTALRIYFRF